MLRIYETMLEMVRDLGPMIETIAKRDGGLGDQMRRAVQSVVLNTAEAMGSRGKNRQARYHSALGSMRETWACVEVAAALGYVEMPSRAVEEKMRHVSRTLVKLTA